MSFEFAYPATIEQGPDQRFTVSFADLPEALTDGATLDEALFNAADALAEAIAGRIDDDEEIPAPSPAQRGNHIIPVPSQVAAKAALHLTMKQARITKVALAKRLGVNEKEVRRLLNPYYRSGVPKIEGAMKALGRSFHICMPESFGQR